MYKIVAKKDYIDKRPELIIKYFNNKEIDCDENGNAKIIKDSIYYVEDIERANQIKESGLAEVEEIKEKKEKKVETTKKKIKAETAIKKTKKLKSIDNKGTIK